METTVVFLPDHVPVRIQALIAEVNRRLNQWYGQRLNRVILYGSYARGDFHKESDIDLLAVLNDAAVVRVQEILALSPLKHDLMLEYGIDISIKAVTLRTYTSSLDALYYFIRREGVLL